MKNFLGATSSVSDIAKRIARCRDLVSRNGGTAPEKLKVLYQAYRSLQTSTDFDRYLHLPQNACIHQKSLSGLSPIVAEIIDQSVLEGSFTCPCPRKPVRLFCPYSVFCSAPVFLTGHPSSLITGSGPQRP
ncbi:hypothetical protein DW091_06870 [Eubacterium sp. AM05-23]|uniref:hypothetical protein n=1 Tax=Eubacterium TaxID=1730 RepID=UPI000E4DBF8C|nr:MULTISPECIES: hypothetical protein [Eubacterium]RHO59461.1 hypothetical protein DW091_06870 [Eubacterium sp. AM05-23]